LQNKTKITFLKHILPRNCFHNNIAKFPFSKNCLLRKWINILTGNFLNDYFRYLMIILSLKMTYKTWRFKWTFSAESKWCIEISSFIFDVNRSNRFKSVQSYCELLDLFPLIYECFQVVYLVTLIPGFCSSKKPRFTSKMKLKPMDCSFSALA